MQVEGLEIFKEPLYNFRLIGIFNHEDKTTLQSFVYISYGNCKLQIESNFAIGRESYVFIKQVNEFTIPSGTKQCLCFKPNTENNIFDLEIEKANLLTDFDKKYKEFDGLKVINTDYFTLALEEKPYLKANEDNLEKISYFDLIEKIL